MVAAIWLGWQVLVEFAETRLPPFQAVRLAPNSPTALSRAAEAEYAAKRFENAELLATEALRRAPFDVRALRVLGLARSEAGEPALADQLLTLSGNWSLRDDPSHAWVMHHRLRTGNFASAFAHADTLARRREDLWPSIFNLFTMAIIEDQRAAPHVAALLAKRPPWRHAYLYSLLETDRGLGVAVMLAVMLETGGSGHSATELGDLYVTLMSKGQFALMAELRRHLGRPPLGDLLVNGDFAATPAVRPFDWSLYTAAGMFAEILPEGDGAGTALRAQHGSFGTDRLAEQITMLAPGRYQLVGEFRSEAGNVGERLGWKISCQGSASLIGESTIPDTADASQWSRFSFGFTVPTDGCPVQWLRLAPNPGTRRTVVVGWFDRMAIQPLD